MQKILLGIGVIVIVTVGWFLLGGNTTNYVAEVQDEVAALEAELAEIEAAVAAGTMTPEAAAEAQTRIAARLDTINSAVASSQSKKLTTAQQAQLTDGLNRLKRVLINYQATLAVVDETVLELPESERPQLPRRGTGGRNSIADVIEDTIAIVEEHAEDVVEDYLPDDTIDTASTSAAMTDETSTTSDDTSIDGDTATSPTATSSDEEPLVEVDAEVSVEGEADATTTDTEEELQNQ